MDMALARKISYLREVGKLSDGVIAFLMGSDVDTVNAWVRQAQKPTHRQADRLTELATMVERLTRAMESGYVPIWLQQPLPALDGEKPLDLFARGDHLRLSRLVSELESPTLS
jgi:hypothetical protein